MSAHWILISALFTITYVDSLLQIETINHGQILPQKSVPNVSQKLLRNDNDIDVIKNISRVNNALQELIKNYEHLQKIYKAESIESNDYSTDSEMDERFKSDKHKKKNRSKNDVTSPKTSAYAFPATQLIGFDNSEELHKHSASNDDTKSIGSESVEINVKQRIPKIEHLQAPPAPQKKVITYKFEDSDSETRESVNERQKTPVARETTKKAPEIIFVNMHKSDTKPKEPQIMESIASKPNTRYKKIKHRGELRTTPEGDLSFSAIVKSQQRNSSDNEVGQLESETKPVLWNQITDTHQNRDPNFRTQYVARLKSTKYNRDNFVNNITDTQNDEIFKTRLRLVSKEKKPRREFSSDYQTSTVTLRDNELNIQTKTFATSNQPNRIPVKQEDYGPPVVDQVKDETWGKITSIRIKKLEPKVRAEMEKKQDEVNMRPDRISYTVRNIDSNKELNEDKRAKDSDAESDAEEREINKEMFKTKILRKAYGDACSKVVVKKCHKACKSVLKRVCISSSCKSSFKDSFKKHAKTGCISEFANDTASSAGKRSGTEHISINKDDFFAAACWPLLNPIEKIKVPRQSTLNESTLQLDEQLNILRDRYEKACAKSSATKCNAACDYASTQSCKDKDCPKKRKRSLQKNCKSECREAYRVYRKKSKSSTSSSSSSDDDDE
ncbi:uncharacterized protein LOC128681108 isoform X2 [Plodia interpunctella]|uniref:uncharacterized protein LOC128681108 isoform X2 n=1 Tax=Plodia interpunctella TaxID=58824 RepID=UPI002368C033|nr:uncharacterized protein LOC128681108 isoform X2 [Plodia interpunctella]